jgi:hypothetical protein
MYSWELKNFINERNKYLGGDDLLKIISLKENPQLNHIIFNPYNNIYEMWDNCGNYYNFKAMPFEEAKQKGLVKQKKRLIK